MHNKCVFCGFVVFNSFLKTTTNSSCVCTHLTNKADSDSDSDVVHRPMKACFHHRIKNKKGIVTFYFTIQTFFQSLYLLYSLDFFLAKHNC